MILGDRLPKPATTAPDPEETFVSSGLQRQVTEPSRHLHQKTTGFGTCVSRPESVLPARQRHVNPEPGHPQLQIG